MSETERVSDGVRGCNSKTSKNVAAQCQQSTEEGAAKVHKCVTYVYLVHTLAV